MAKIALKAKKKTNEELLFQYIKGRLARARKALPAELEINSVEIYDASLTEENDWDSETPISKQPINSLKVINGHSKEQFSDEGRFVLTLAWRDRATNRAHSYCPNYSVSLRTVPSCCGILLVHELTSLLDPVATYDYNRTFESTSKLNGIIRNLNLDIVEFLAVWRNYTAIQMNIPIKWSTAELKERGYKVVHEFNNRRTSNDVAVWIKSIPAVEEFLQVNSKMPKIALTA